MFKILDLQTYPPTPADQRSKPATQILHPAASASPSIPSPCRYRWWASAKGASNTVLQRAKQDTLHHNKSMSEQARLAWKKSSWEQKLSIVKRVPGRLREWKLHLLTTQIPPDRSAHLAESLTTLSSDIQGREKGRPFQVRPFSCWHHKVLWIPSFEEGIEWIGDGFKHNIENSRQLG